MAACYVKQFSSVSSVRPFYVQFSWPLSCGHDMVSAAPGIIPMLKQEEEGKEVVLVWSFCNWRIKHPPEILRRCYLMFHWSILGHFAILCCHARWIENKIVMTIFNLLWFIPGSLAHCHLDRVGIALTRKNKGWVMCQHPPVLTASEPITRPKVLAITLEALGLRIRETGPR